MRVLYQQLDDVHAVAEPEVVPPHERAPRATADIEEQIRDDPVLVAVADSGAGAGDVAGFAHIRIIPFGPHFVFPAVPEIEELAVLEGMRGRGIGRRLMEAAEDWATAAGYPEI